MKFKSVAGLVSLAVAAGAMTCAQVMAKSTQCREAEARLDELVDRAIDEGQPFFTPAERAVIERACGYAAGSWNGFQVNMIGNVFHCTNGRRVSSPEVQAVMAAASPRIDAHVDRALDRPEIVTAMERIGHTDC